MAGALFGSTVLILGLLGMAMYSAPTTASKKKDEKQELVRTSSSISMNSVDTMELELPLLDKRSSTLMDVETSPKKTKPIEIIQRRKKNENKEQQSTIEDATTPTPTTTTANKMSSACKNNNLNGTGDDIVDDVAFLGDAPMKEKKDEVNDSNNALKDSEVMLFGRIYTKRQLGIAGAIINGAWGSNNMVPMHYARADGFYGAGYLISYSSGSMIVTIAMWLIRYLINVYKLGGDHVKAYHALPSFHLRQMWKTGLTSGLLYSLGNFFTIVSVSVLGQGVGYSFVQTSMLISGLWGIFVFGEVKGSQRIMKWLASSVVTVIGILLLSYEHVHVAPSDEVESISSQDGAASAD